MSCGRAILQDAHPYHVAIPIFGIFKQPLRGESGIDG